MLERSLIDYTLVRETFRTWIADFIPSCGGVYSGTHLTIEGFRNEILERFPETRAEYDLATAKAETQKGQRDIYSRVIKASIPIEQDTNPRWRDVTAAVLRDIIMRSDYSLGFAPTRSLQICNGLYDEQEVKTFVEEAWKIVGDEAWDCYYGPSGKHSHHLEARLAEEAEMQACEGEGETYESDDEEDRIRFQSKPEGFRQTWYDTDMNDI